MNSLFNIKDKCVALSGGTGTLGGSISTYLAENGAKIILLGRTKNKLDSKCVALNAIKEDCATSFEVDVLNETEMLEVKAKIAKEYGMLDGLINLAGGNVPGATLTAKQTIYDIELKDTKSAIDLNLYGTIIPTMVLSELMANQGHGSIINISSMASKQAISRVLGYSVAKAGIDIFTKWMANEMASKFTDAIRVNAVAPGFFIGNQNRRLLTDEDGGYTARGETIIKNTPMGRFGEASELNGIVHYLLSSASSFVTGEIFDVDGGFSSFSGV